MAKIETLGQWKAEALTLLNGAEAEIRANARLSGYGDDEVGFTGYRIRENATAMQDLIELLPASPARDRAKVARDVLHQLTMFEPGDEHGATALLNMAKGAIQGLGKPGR